MSRYVPLLLGGKVVAYGSEAQVQDLRDRLRARGHDATVPATCDGCGRRRPSVPAVIRDGDVALCRWCARRADRYGTPLNCELEAERRGGAEPE